MAFFKLRMTTRKRAQNSAELLVSLAHRKILLLRGKSEKRAGNSIPPSRIRQLFLVEAGNAGQLLALQELQGGAAAGGDVGHLVRKAQLLHSRRGVAAADDGDRAAALLLQ